jgi:hypothetical protein
VHCKEEMKGCQAVCRLETDVVMCLMMMPSSQEGANIPGWRSLAGGMNLPFERQIQKRSLRFETLIHGHARVFPLIGGNTYVFARGVHSLKSLIVLGTVVRL